MNWKLCGGIFNCIIALIFFGVMAGLGIRIASHLNTQEAILYGSFSAFVAFWWLILILIAFLRMIRINGNNISYENHQCFNVRRRALLISVLMNKDFVFQRLIAFALSVTQFYVSMRLLSRISINSDSFDSFFDDFQYTLPLFMFNIVFGAGIQIALILHLFLLIFNYETYDFSITYYVHIKKNINDETKFQQNMVKISFLVCFLCILYYLWKAIILILICIYTENINWQCFCAFIIICSVFCISILIKTASQVITISQFQESQAQNPYYNINLICFISWSELLYSLLYEQRNSIQFKIVYLLVFIQSLYGIIAFPFWKIFDIAVEDVYTTETYLYWDTFIIQYILIWQLLQIISRKIHSIQEIIPIYNFSILYNQINKQIYHQVAPIQQQIEIIQPVIGQPIQIEQQEILGICTLCLNKMNKDQQIRRMLCNPQHFFHEICMGKWNVNHHDCPLCHQSRQ